MTSMKSEKILLLLKTPPPFGGGEIRSAYLEKYVQKLNDFHGHLIGDEVLMEIAKVLQKTVRKYDIPSRFGGEEFLILLPETDVTKAKKVAERLRKSLPNNLFLKKYNVQISLGVTEYKKLDTQKRMIARADKALYVSKKQGRNQTNIL